MGLYSRRNGKPWAGFLKQQNHRIDLHSDPAGWRWDDGKIRKNTRRSVKRLSQSGKGAGTVISAMEMERSIIIPGCSLGWGRGPGGTQGREETPGHVTFRSRIKEGGNSGW